MDDGRFSGSASAGKKMGVSFILLIYVSVTWFMKEAVNTSQMFIIFFKISNI